MVRLRECSGNNRRERERERRYIVIDTRWLDPCALDLEEPVAVALALEQPGAARRCCHLDHELRPRLGIPLLTVVLHQEQQVLGWGRSQRGVCS